MIIVCCSGHVENGYIVSHIPTVLKMNYPGLKSEEFF